MSGKRVLFLDYAKGLGIMLMLFQHSIPQLNLWRLFIQAFVMPLFFIVGGFIWQIKEVQGHRQLSLSKAYLSKRLKQLAPAYFVGCIVLALFYEVLSISQGNHSISHNLCKIVSLQGIDSMWFLPVYFISEILFLSVVGLHNFHLRFAIVIVSILFLTFIVKFEGSPWPFALIEKSVLGLLFFIGGYLLSKKKNKILDKPLMILLLLLPLGLLGAYFNGFTSFAELHYPILYLFNGVALTTALLALSKYMDSYNKRYGFLLLFGRGTLIVLCSNNLFIEIIRLLDYKLCGDYLLNHGMIGNCQMFLLLIIIETIFLVVYNRFHTHFPKKTIA